MYKRVLLALDLEGVNNVVGEAYMGLGHDTEQWKVARVQAVKELNVATQALFDAGVEKVGVWDNHGGGNNVDPSALDSRIELINAPLSLPRMSFIKDNYDCICYFGYHTMEGTLSGVLAHTMNSKEVQFYKLNGKYIGEIDMDSAIASSYGIPSRFFVGGNIACSQAKRSVPDIVTVVTKTELGRNVASFRNDDELFADIKTNIVKAVTQKSEARPMTFPAIMQKSFKRTEDAVKYLDRLRNLGLNSEYLDDEILGKDAHTVVTTVRDISEFINSI